MQECWKKGHYQSHFPSEEQDGEDEVEGASHFQVENSSHTIDSDRDSGIVFFQRVILMSAMNLEEEFVKN